MWRLCALCAVLVAGEPCDDGRFNIHVDLPDEGAYLCNGDYITPSSTVSPSIATRYKQENTFHACMDVKINYSVPIPNSGAHRPIWAKYGEYIYCPPQRFVHNLQHAGVAFLYHPCVDSPLKDTFSYVARSYVPRHIITPLPSLSREKPLALAAWCSTLEMSHINLTEISHWLKENVYQEWQNITEQDGTYQHLLIRPAAVSLENTNPDRVRKFQVLGLFGSRRGQSLWRRLKKKKRAVLAVMDLAQDGASNISSSTSAGHPTGTTTKTNDTITLPAAHSTRISPRTSIVSSPPVILISDLAGKADIHSRETERMEKVPVGELEVRTIPSTLSNISDGDPEPYVSQAIGSNISLWNEEKGPQSSQSETQDGHHADSLQTKSSLNSVSSPKVTKPPQHPHTERTLLPSTTDGAQKQKCSCKHNTETSPPRAQRRLGAGQQKSSDAFISTPRTEEATWAAASLIFLFGLLTFSVLYTQIYKKFRKSQSLYWSTESYTEEKETVASIIKRRLVQGHSGRKKWFGRKKVPTVLYENLSESSD